MTGFRVRLLAVAAWSVACGGSVPYDGDSAPDAGRWVADDDRSFDAGDTGEPDAALPDPVDEVPAPEPWWLQGEDDFAGDGVTAGAGDCDDGEPAVRPGRADLCNGRDDDCDGRIDEDVDGDANLPALGAALDLGNLTYADERIIEGLLFPSTDVDRFVLRVDDVATRNFDIEAWVYGVPRAADFVLELYWIADASGRSRGLVQRSDAAGPGGYEVVNHGGSFGTDDSGRYGIVLRSKSGADCRFPYQLQVLIGGV